MVQFTVCKSFILFPLIGLASSSLFSMGLTSWVPAGLKRWAPIIGVNSVARTATAKLNSMASQIDNPLAKTLANKVSEAVESQLNDTVSPEDEEERKKEVSKLLSQVFTFSASKTTSNPLTKELLTGLSETVNKDTADAGREKLTSAATNILAISLANGLVTTATAGISNPITNFLATTGARLFATAVSKHFATALNNRLAEEYKKRTATGINPVEALSSAMEDVGKDVPYEIQKEPKARLGCEFSDDEYSFQANKKAFYTSAPVATWSKYPLDPMEFKSQEEWDTFKADLTELCASVMESVRYNDVDQLLRFISQYKDQKRSLGKFYTNYKYKFRPYEDTAVFELKLINLLKLKYKDVVDHFYLITAYMDVPENYSKEFAEIARGFPRDFFHGHVAGAIRILLKGNRAGYIIMDLSLGVYKPIVLMEDGQAPHSDTTSRGYGKKITYHIAGKDSPFVWAKIYEDNAEKTVVSKHLYYVRKPYCSFLEVTFKPNLLIPIHGMLIRRSNGFKKAHVNFRILPKKLLGKDYYFNIVSFDEEGNTGSGMSIPFESLANMTSAQNYAMSQVAQDLGLTQDLLWGKLAAVKLLIFDDDQLVNEIYELNKEYQHLDEASAQNKTETPQQQKQETAKHIQSADNPEESLTTMAWGRRILDNVISYGYSTYVNLGAEKRENFAKATKYQNEFVKKPHLTNLA